MLLPKLEARYPYQKERLNSEWNLITEPPTDNFINQLKIKIMTVTVELTKRTALEEMIIRNNKSEMSEMILAKQKALAEAEENAEFYRSIGQADMADNEASRARMLERQIKSLSK